jgi:hypothetical protein
MSVGGFTVEPGQKIPQSVSAKFEGGLIVYYLVFSADRCVTGCGEEGGGGKMPWSCQAAGYAAT